MFARALVLYRRHFASLVLTCAVALVPANLLAAGTVAFGLASLGKRGVAETRGSSPAVQGQPPAAQDSLPSSQQDRAQQLRVDAADGGAREDVNAFFGAILPVAYATLVVAALLLAGLFLAHAAAVPLVLELSEGRPAGAAHAWAGVGARFPAVAATGVLGAVLVAVGTLCFVLPGVLLATGFSLAVPIAMEEGVSGRAALEKSWRGLHGRWGTALGMWALILAFSVLASLAAAAAPAGPLRPLIAALVRVLLYPLPLAGLVLLYLDARGQYMRRISAPG
ncbi:MAG TPA: hypothetical protein VFE90_03835 [Myxococcales bacterium]|nr:hypothetical protein [Myxococcales bacterium]